MSKSNVLGPRALNRALLERQFLLRRAELPALEAIHHLVGLQSQATNPPYFGLWTRLEGFRQQDLSVLIERRRVVRIAMMRSTIHLVSARDCLALRRLLQPVLIRQMNGTYGGRLAGLDLKALAAAGRALVDESPRTFSQLGKLLRERWPDRDPAALVAAVRAGVPLVQIPPRGLWGASGQAVHVSAETWLGQGLEPTISAEALILRYLAAFGPATIKDIQVWSGLTQLNDQIRLLRPQLRCFRDSRGTELFDLADAPRPEPGASAPARFLAPFDNLLLSHADRTRIVADEHRPRLMTINGLVPGTVLVDGFVAGTWKILSSRGASTLTVESFDALRKRDRDELAKEGSRLLDFAASGTSGKDIRFVQQA